MLKVQKSNNHFGFTLIELLIAISILVIISTLLMVAFAQFSKNREILLSHTKDLAELQIGVSIISNDLSQIVNWQRVVSPKELGSFYTQNNVLHFSSMGNINPQYILPRSTIQKIEYELLNENLVKTVYRYDGSKNYSRVILTGIKRLSWVFIDQNLKTYPLWPPVQAWHNTLPNGLRIILIHQKYGKIEKTFFLPERTQGFSL